ncbi:MAG: hypothetical protein ACO3CQ_00530 [Candidatus Nanopelagicaceae bacterium]
MATVTFTFGGSGIGPLFNVVMTHNGSLGSAPVGSLNTVTGTTITNVITRDPANGNAIIGPGSGWTPLYDSGTGFVGTKAGITSPFTSSTLCEYISWRSQNTNQHPSTGYSFDLWYDQGNSTAQNILSGIFNNSPTATWAQLRDAGSLPISSDYWTLVYDYDNKYPIAWRKGGNVTVTLA